MVDVQSVFKKYKINPERSINRIIQDLSSSISESRDPFVLSNQLIGQLGSTTVQDYNEAPFIAKCLVEQAVIMKEYDPVAAREIANQKLANMRAKHSWMFASSEKEKTVTSAITGEVTKAAKAGNDKKAKALAIFEANRGKKASDIARLIQMELDVSFANAYYYVSRVFK